MASNLTVSISPFLIICHVSHLSIHDMIPQFVTVSIDADIISKHVRQKVVDLSSLPSYLTSHVTSYLTRYVASDVKRLVTSCFTRY